MERGVRSWQAVSPSLGKHQGIRMEHVIVKSGHIMLEEKGLDSWAGEGVAVSTSV